MDLGFIRPRMVVLVDHISKQEWREFSEVIQCLPTQPHLTLVKFFFVLPWQFYQLSSAFALEYRIKQAAFSTLSTIEHWLGFATMHQIIPTNQFTTTIRCWKKENDLMLIGKQRRNAKALFFRTPVITEITQWLAYFQNSEKYSLKY